MKPQTSQKDKNQLQAQAPQQPQVAKQAAETPHPSAPRKMSRTMEAAYRLKGSLIVNDPAFLL